MRKIIVSEFVTLDGVMGSPDKWSFQFGPDAAKFKFDELFSSDALLLGRVTYQGFAAAWPAAKDEAGFADRMNGLPKFVVSTTLQEPEWNNTTVIKDNVVDEVTRLKQQPGQDILIFGSADLVHTLMEHGLIDEYRLMIYPIVQRSGKHLFREGSDPSRMKLVDSKPFSSGVVVLIYEPAPHE